MTVLCNLAQHVHILYTNNNYQLQHFIYYTYQKYNHTICLCLTMVLVLDQARHPLLTKEHTLLHYTGTNL